MFRVGILAAVILCVAHAQFDDMEARRERAIEYNSGMRLIPDFVPILSSSNSFLIADAFYHQNGVFDPAAIKDGDIIYIPTPIFTQFMQEAFPKINAKVVILSPVRYSPKTRQIEGSDGTYKWYEKMLDDPRTVAWFAENLKIKHPKAHPLPLGCCWFKPQQYKLQQRMLEKTEHASYFAKKKFKCYVNYRCRDAHRTRLRKFLGQPERRNMFRFSKPKRFGKYCEDLRNAEFVISPKGVNPDCYRTWEALYAGSIPIVERTGMEEIFDDLPVIIIDNYAELSPEFLEQAKADLQKKTFNLDKLYSKYWLDQILAASREAKEG